MLSTEQDWHHKVHGWCVWAIVYAQWALRKTHKRPGALTDTCMGMRMPAWLELTSCDFPLAWLRPRGPRPQVGARWNQRDPTRHWQFGAAPPARRSAGRVATGLRARRPFSRAEQEPGRAPQAPM